MIVIGCDHGGFELKNMIKDYLVDLDEMVLDVGAFEIDDLDDFSTYAKLVAKNMKEENAKGIAICGSGVGMCIALNKFKGIYAVNGIDEEKVKLAREHNNVNALCLGGRMVEVDSAKKMVKAFLDTEFLGGKYQKRIDDIDNMG